MNRALLLLTLPTAVTLFTRVAMADGTDPGQAMLKRCEICHSLNDGGPNRVGPNLHGVFGRTAGAAPGFAFSPAMKNSGIVWDDQSLAKFLGDPQHSLPGNRMSFPGITDEATLRELLAALKQATQ
jgi:cytochrome c